MRFRNRKDNIVKDAYSIQEDGDKVFIKFTESGKEYTYYSNNIKILDKKSSLIIYSFERECYKCKKKTLVLTYLLFDDGTDENLVFPWDKHRLNKEKSTEAYLMHMEYEYIEFYPIKVIGSDEELDYFMLKRFPDKINMKHSSTQKRTYPMNICQHCGAKQGEFFVYERLNLIIQKMEKLDVHAQLEI